MVVSIDIGTSYSSICLRNGEDKAKPVETSTGISIYGGKYSLPSAVFVEEGGKVLVGQAAMNSRKKKPQNFRSEFKRDLGQNIPIVLGDRSFLPEELYTELFRHMKGCAEKGGNGTVEKAYITYPASSVADSIMNDVNMKRLVYATFPVCAKAVEGYSSLQEEDWDSLKKLAAVSRNELVDLLFDAEIFAVSDDDYFMEFGNPAVRSRLINALGQYGIMEICQQLSMGTDVNEMKQVLSQRCGITKVRDMLLSHFGNRTFLIKSQFIFNKLRDLSGKLCRTQRDNRRLVDVCEELENKIDELMTGIQTLNELRILQYYYNGQLHFVDDDESEDFMQVTGEYGREPEQRLGVESSVSMNELMRIAKEKTEKWHEKASSFMMPNTYVDAASTIARSYEHIYYYLSALCDE